MIYSRLMMHRPKFIAFDGGEGCGKSTQVKMLHDRLTADSADVLLVRDPGTTRIGEQIRALLLNPDHGEMAMRCEMLLYMAARAQMMVETILPALDGGKLVICDRFVSSTLAYQLGGDGLSAQDIRSIANVAIKGRWPDLTIILDMPVQASMNRLRRSKDRIEQRSMEYHENVRRNYLSQAAEDPAHYRVINAEGPPQEIHANVMSALAD